VKPSTRIYVIMARRSRTAVVFRRGPAKRVLVLRWDIPNNVLEEGQWLHGHLYERRCDLSPSGEYLAYFAAKWKGEYPSYTAISRPPWLTALALWRGLGAWGGGGLFQDERTLLLNHGGSPKVDEGRLDGRFTVAPLGAFSGRGEDNPIWHTRLLRDGWRLVQGRGESRRSDLSGVETTVAGKKTKVWMPIDPPWIYERVQPTAPKARLQMRISGLHEIGGPWYALDHVILDEKENERASLGRSDWADWDETGDLLFANGGCIHRVARTDVFDAEATARLLFDLRDRKPTNRVSPQWAREWQGKRPRPR
jgi:hypothetical protein